MEKDTANISIKKLEELISENEKFKLNLSLNKSKQNTILVKSGLFTKYEVVTDSEATKILAEDLRSQIEKTKELNKEIEIIKQMNYKQFRKWKNQ